MMGRSWVEVDLDILMENIKAVREAVRPETALMVVVKANAYGHGVTEVAKCAAKAGVTWFAVAYIEEALALREAGIDTEILILGVVDPSETPTLIKHRITPVVADLEHGLELAKQAGAVGEPLSVHVKIDTGMGRIGLPWKDAGEQLEVILAEHDLYVSGLCSHFAMVESSEPQVAKNQAERFLKIARSIEESAGRKFFKHLSSSRAILYHKEWDLMVYDRAL